MRGALVKSRWFGGRNKDAMGTCNIVTQFHLSAASPETYRSFSNLSIVVCDTPIFSARSRKEILSVSRLQIFPEAHGFTRIIWFTNLLTILLFVT